MWANEQPCSISRYLTAAPRCRPLTTYLNCQYLLLYILEKLAASEQFHRRAVACMIPCKHDSNDSTINARGAAQRYLIQSLL